MSIRFGTDGWRAVISDEFTFENLRRVAQAIADYALEVGTPERGVVVGYDTRFLSDRYAAEVARVLAGNGVPVYLSQLDCPTPALSYAVQRLGAAGGVMITASHNPPRYNGVKLKAAHGGSALPAETARVEEHLARRQHQGHLPRRADLERAMSAGIVQWFDPLPDYLARLRALVNLEAIGDAGLRVVVDPMYGAGRGYIRALLKEASCAVHEIRGELNPGFGGIHPEPIGQHLDALAQAVTGNGYDLGLATDGDADRVGAMDARGQFVDPHAILTVLLRHLVEYQGQRGAVVKSISTTGRLNILAGRYGLPLHETPVGFSYIAALMLSNDVLIGGEESGGIGVKGHIPESDGILAGLLLLEALAMAGTSLEELLAQIADEIGHFYYQREDVPAPALSKSELVARLFAVPPSTLAGQRVANVNNSDGIKYTLSNDGWLLLRPSGTEPLLRIYAEGRSPEQVAELLIAGRRLAGV